MSPRQIVQPRRELSFDWYLRLVALRAAGHFAAIYADGGIWAVSTNLFSPYQSRETYKVPDLQRLIVELEGTPAHPVSVAESIEEFRLHNNLQHMGRAA